MGTLREMYEDLMKDTNRWSYYSNPYYRLSYDKLFSNESCYEFIINYFMYSGKEKVFDDPNIYQNSNILKKRSPHIISTYLLGILIAESFKFDINKRDNKNMNFKYLWFLSCLYHDIGYVYENTHNCQHLIMLQTDGIEAMKEICGITYKCKKEFKTYDEELVNTYLSNRAKCSEGKIGVIDHGIAGGLMLYDRLRKNYNQALKKAHKQDSKNKKDSFEYNGLHFSNAHYGYYAKAADAIIAHNIWQDTLNDYLKKERKQQLDDKKIKKNKNEIAFILSLADTLEPIKRYGIFALDMIRFETIDRGFALSMPNNEIKDIYGYILDLPTWLNVNVIEKPPYIFSIKNKE